MLNSIHTKHRTKNELLAWQRGFLVALLAEAMNSDSIVVDKFHQRIEKFKSNNMVEWLRLELRSPLSRTDGLAIRSNTIMGPFRYWICKPTSTFIVDLFRTYRPPSLTSTRDGYHSGSVQRSLLYRPPRFPAGGSWTHLPSTVLVLRRNLDSVTSLADTLKTGFVILWILSVYCSTTSRRNSNLMPHCSIPYPLCEHFGIKRDNKTWSLVLLWHSNIPWARA